MRLRLFIFFFTIIAYNQAIGQHQAQISNSVKIKALDEYFNKAIEDWDVPGMGIAIVTKDDILLSKGYGVKDIKTNEPVDENTIFAVASNSKAFTGASLAILVEQGKLKWDDRVIEHIPWFQLYDPYVTSNMTIRDLLTHRSGLATFSGDLVWYGTTWPAEEVVRRARFLKPVSGFRTSFGYSNIMYLTAGLIIEKVSGKSWGDFVKENFFQPLGMNSSLTSIKQFNNKTNLAQPHTTFEEKTVRIDYMDWDNIAPAGAIISSPNDMAKWIQLQLNMGKIGDKQILSSKSLNEMWHPYITNKVSEMSMQLWPTTHFKGYGLGWSLMDYHGKKVMSHSGGYDGMISYTAFCPEGNMGLVVVTNKNSSLYLPMMYKILDTFLSSDTTDWSQVFLGREKMMKDYTSKQEQEKKDKRVLNTKTSLDLEKYTGIYTSELYGEGKVSLRNGQLYLEFIPTPLFHGELNHWHYDTFTIQFPEVPSLPQGTVNFILNADGEVEQMRVDIPNPDFDFTELEFRK